MKIRLVFPLRFHHFEIPAGEIIDIRPELAHQAINRSIAESVEPERAVVAPQERRGPGRPRKYPEVNHGNKLPDIEDRASD